MKKQILLLCAAVPAIMAQNSPAPSTAPEFAADWRVTGIVRQGARAQASLERTGLRARFAEEGDLLPGDVVVLQVDYASRSVTLAKDGETAVIRVGCAMAPPPPPPKNAATQPSSNKGSPPSSWPNPPQKVSALRDGNGRWHVVFPNGRAVDMHGVTERYGGIQGTRDYLKQHTQQQHSDEGQEFHKQQFEALKQMEKAGAR